MKIAVIGAKGLPAKQGGIEHYCQELYSGMVAQGHSVDLFARASYTKKSWFSSYHYQGVRVICLPSLPLRGLDAFTSAAIGAIATSFRDYDIVHFHALGPAIFCWLPRLATPAEVCVTCHGLDWQRTKWGKFSSRLIRLGEKTAVNYANQLVVVSEYLHSYFWNSYGIDTKYIPTAPASYADCAPQFPHLDFLGTKPGCYLLFLGRLVPEKRPDLLIEAFQKLQPQGWQLLLAGAHSDTTEFSVRLQELANDNPNIIFTGELQGSNLAEVMRGAGLFILPSDLEGLPLVMLEAMREGIPVIASDIPAHRQLLGKDRGLLFEQGNVNSLIKILEQSLERPLELAMVAQRARKYVKAHYTWEKVTYENLKLYAQLRRKIIGFGEHNQRLEECFQEIAALLYEKSVSPQKDRLDQALRQQILEQFNQQLDLVLAHGRKEIGRG